MKRPRIKICCISNIAEAKLAIDFGASALGLVGKMPSGPGIIDDPLIATIAKTIPPPVASVLLTSETEALGIIDHYKKVNTTAIQLVDALKEDQYAIIKQALPHIKLVQVIHVAGEHAIGQALLVAELADAVLLDSGNPELPVKELGGTGRTHNWEISRAIREILSIPVFLAGGLNEKNIRQAIDAVQPYGIDVCSGVRTGGALDPVKLKGFFSAIEKSYS